MLRRDPLRPDSTVVPAGRSVLGGRDTWRRTSSTPWGAPGPTRSRPDPGPARACRSSATPPPDTSRDASPIASGGRRTPASPRAPWSPRKAPGPAGTRRGTGGRARGYECTDLDIRILRRPPEIGALAIELDGSPEIAKLLMQPSQRILQA